MRTSFPNHIIACKLLCTNKRCTDIQYPHTDNKKWTCRFIHPHEVHVCHGSGKRPICSKQGDKPVSRNECPFSSFLSIEADTSLIIGTSFNYNYATSELLNPRRHAIHVNNAKIISGSTGHAGTPFPEVRRRSSSREVKVVEGKPIQTRREEHYRVFFEGIPMIGPYWSKELDPQLKFATEVDVSMLLNEI